MVEYDRYPPMRLGPGKLYMVEKDGTHTLIAEVKEGWTPGMNQEEYHRFRSECCFLRVCIDGVKCHHPENTPQGCSWGECNWLGCPMNKLKED